MKSGLSLRELAEEEFRKNQQEYNATLIEHAKAQDIKNGKNQPSQLCDGFEVGQFTAIFIYVKRGRSRTIGIEYVRGDRLIVEAATTVLPSGFFTSDVASRFVKVSGDQARNQLQEIILKADSVDYWQLAIKTYEFSQHKLFTSDDSFDRVLRDIEKNYLLASEVDSELQEPPSSYAQLNITPARPENDSRCVML